MDKHCIYIDGDGVGLQLHALLISSELKEAFRLSTVVTSAVGKIEAMLRAAGAEVVFSGGDNVFARAEPDSALLARIVDLFRAETGLTTSIGVGKTPGDALLALTTAKALGGGRIEWR